MFSLGLGIVTEGELSIRILKFRILSHSGICVHTPLLSQKVHSKYYMIACVINTLRLTLVALLKLDYDNLVYTANVRSPGAQGTTTGDHFNFPPPPLPSELNQKDTSKAVDPAQKVKSLPRYLPTSKDPVADALRLNRHKKAHSASPEDATNTSNSTSEAPTSPTDDGGPSRPTEYDRQDQFQYPNSHHHQQFQQHQQQQQQQSHDPNQWSHGQVDEAPLQHYDSLKCRDDYLAHQVQVQQQMQQQQQQMHGEIGAHLAPPPPPSAPRSTTSDLNPAQASRSHSTINPEDLSSQDQDMAGSLLDLADELGEAESPTTGQNRRMVEEHTGTATITTISSTAAQQAMDRNGRFMQESPRTADRQVGYHSYTLPHSFSGGGHAGGGGRSPRARNDGGGGGSDGDSGPPKPPRTDYPPKGGEHHSGSGEMQGNSPYLPGSSFTTGRQHQKKRNLVRNWVQDQQLRYIHRARVYDSLHCYTVYKYRRIPRLCPPPLCAC